MIKVQDILSKTRQDTMVRLLLPGCYSISKVGYIEGLAKTLMDVLIPHYLAMDVEDIFVSENRLVLCTISKRTIEILGRSEEEEDEDFADEGEADI